MLKSFLRALHEMKLLLKRHQRFWNAHRLILIFFYKKFRMAGVTAIVICCLSIYLFIHLASNQTVNCRLKTYPQDCAGHATQKGLQGRRFRKKSLVTD